MGITQRTGCSGKSEYIKDMKHRIGQNEYGGVYAYEKTGVHSI